MAWTPSTFHGIRIRHAVSEDREFAMSMVPRLVAASPVWWRHPRKLFAAYVQVIESVFEAARPDAALLIAERSDELALGLALLVAASDCFTHKRQGLVAQVAVTDVGSDASAGYVLIIAAETLARSRGHRLLMLGEFRTSHPANAMWPGPEVGGPSRPEALCCTWMCEFRGRQDAGSDRRTI